MRETLIACLDEADAIIRSYFRGEFKLDVKKDRSFVTEADVAVEKAIVKRIKEKFPSHGIIGEEEGIQEGEEYTWVIDPIDGTAPFSAGLTDFGTLIAVLKNHEPVLAGVHFPAKRKRYIAEKGKGATCNGEPLKTGTETDLRKVMWWFGTDPKEPDVTRKEGGIYASFVMNTLYVIGANGPFQIATVADGRVGGMTNLFTKIWDIAAPSLILQESGAVVTDANGKPHDFNISDPNTIFTIVAANSELHAKAIEIIKSQS